MVFCRADAEQELKKKRKTIFQSAAKYVKEYQSAERNLIRMRRQARDNGNYFIEPSPKVVFVVRIRGYASPPHIVFSPYSPLPAPASFKFPALLLFCFCFVCPPAMRRAL
jgi:hypothetical protein